MESLAQISFSSITLTCTCRTDSRTGGPERQAMRRIDVNPLLMTLPTPLSLPLLVTTRKTFSDELCACPCGTFDWPCGFCMAQGVKEREREGDEGSAGRQRQGGEYCKIQYLGNDACADSCVQNVTGNAIRCEQRIKQDAMRCGASQFPRFFN